MNVYVEAFLPLFVAMNPMAVLPLFIGLTEGMSASARRRLVVQALTTAFVVALVILFAGQVIFRALGITMNDLRVGGGLILLVLSISDLVFSEAQRRMPENGDANDASGIGVVPLGIPLIVGPAAITTILVSQQSYGYLPTLTVLLVNLALALVVYWAAPALIERLGAGTAKAIGKVASLFLAAIAVGMIRAGIVGMIGG